MIKKVNQLIIIIKVFVIVTKMMDIYSLKNANNLIKPKWNSVHKYLLACTRSCVETWSPAFTPALLTRSDIFIREAGHSSNLTSAVENQSPLFIFTGECQLQSHLTSCGHVCVTLSQKSAKKKSCLWLVACVAHAVITIKLSNSNLYDLRYVCSTKPQVLSLLKPNV